MSDWKELVRDLGCGAVWIAAFVLTRAIVDPKSPLPLAARAAVLLASGAVVVTLTVLACRRKKPAEKKRGVQS